MFTKAIISGFVCLSICVVVSAQIPGQPYRIDDKEVEKMIRRIEQQSDRFKSSLDSALDKSRLNDTTREDDINAFVKGFYERTKHLREQFNHRRSASADVQGVLDQAARIDGFVSRTQVSSRAQEDWNTLKSYLSDLANAYNVGWSWGSGPMGGSVSSEPYRVSDKEVERVLSHIEKQSDKFRSALDSALDKSRFDGTNREDDINLFVKNFYQATKKLRDRFNDHKSTSADVQSVLDRAAEIDRFVRRNSLRDKPEREWLTLKDNLAELARMYNVSWQWS
jgi:hypothetical protein